ncbi:conserved exported protein of unknown function [Tenacibaculum sp. 190524A02b]|uniref:SIMPL domain-containing protein n=1 Tax=Tenacibaculum vairaonense TaxID=3137860 RepID=A0ABM9PI95_9FLAO
MKNLYFLLFILLSGNLFSQINKEPNPYIDVNGKAEMEIVPNLVHIDVCLQERMENGEKLTLKKIENSLKNELNVIGISEKELYISDINSIVAKTSWWKTERFSVGKYLLKVKQIDKLQEVFKVFEKLKITDASIIKATHSNLADYRKKNRINAIKAAKEKADYLLNAINAKTGKPIKVNEMEQNFQDFAQINYVGNSNLYSSRISKIKSFEKGTIQFENIKLISTIHVVFEIK